MSAYARFASLIVVAISLFALPERASAARVLFVSDDGTDLSIGPALQADGHDVTTVERDFSLGMNPTLTADLSAYDCVVWSATNDGGGSTHSDPTVFSNLENYVSNGGSVFVTGWGSVNIGDRRLIDFLGAGNGTSFSGSPSAIADLDTNLTTGVIDIRGIVPTDYASFGSEALMMLQSDTVALVTGSFSPGSAQWSIRTVGSGHIAWVAGVQFSDRQWGITGGGSAGAYNAALRNFVNASEGTALMPGAPRVMFAAPFSASEGASIDITVNVTDDEGDTVTWSWDLDGDGNFGEMPGATAVSVPEGTTDGPGRYLVAVEASDGVHTTRRSRSISIANVAPMVTSSPPTVAAIDQHIRYAIGVEDPGGVHDPLTFTFVTGPTTAQVTPEGIFEWTPTPSEVTAAGTMRSVVVDIDDGDMGTTRHQWSVVVIDDHAPSDPTQLYPVMDAALLIPGVHLTIGNSSDLDGDPITYTFEVDSTMTFDSPDYQSAEGVAGDPSGITTHPLDEARLHYGRWFWRVTATDGRVTTSPSIASFLLVPDPTMQPDAGPMPDAGRDGGSSVVETPRGCGCGVASASRPGGIGLLLAAIGVVIAKRRARR